MVLGLLWRAWIVKTHNYALRIYFESCTALQIPWYAIIKYCLPCHHGYVHLRTPSTKTWTSSENQELLRGANERLSSLGQTSLVQPAYHISLSRTVPIDFNQIEPLVNSLNYHLSKTKRRVHSLLTCGDHQSRQFYSRVQLFGSWKHHQTPPLSQANVALVDCICSVQSVPPSQPVMCLVTHHQ